MTWSPVSPGPSRDARGHRGKGGKQGGANSPGKRHIPPGVKAAIQAVALTGEMPQAEIARQFEVSRDLVARLAQQAADVDREQVNAITRGLPALMKVATAGFAVKTIELLEQGDYGAATKTMFGAKLGTEATRWAQPAADSPGSTLLEFIQALHTAGGGSLTVGPQTEPVPDEVIEVTAVEVPPDV